MTQPVFYDIEASSLHGYPIEIGWAFLDPETSSIKVESILIQPPTNWDIVSSWDENAENLHFISLAELHRNGHPPEEVARRLNAALCGRLIYSDAPSWDQNWIGMIFSETKISQNFTTVNINAYELIGQSAKDNGRDESECLAIISKVEQAFPRTHRAGEDARHLAELYRAMTS